MSGLGNYIDGKFLERYPAKHQKEFEQVYPTLESILATVKKPETPKPSKPRRKLSPPNFRRRKKKR